MNTSTSTTTSDRTKALTTERQLKYILGSELPGYARKHPHCINKPSQQKSSTNTGYVVQEWSTTLVLYLKYGELFSYMDNKSMSINEALAITREETFPGSYITVDIPAMYGPTGPNYVNERFPDAQSFSFTIPSTFSIIQLVGNAGFIPILDFQSLIQAIHENKSTDTVGLVFAETGTTPSGFKYSAYITRELLYKPQYTMRYYLSASFIISDNQVANIECIAEERGITGMRSATILSKILHETKQETNETGTALPEEWQSDPYDRSFTRGLLSDKSEAEKYDTLFPDQALSIVRRNFRKAVETISPR